MDPVGGEENQLNNKITRVVNVEARKPRILYIQGEPVWEYKFIRRAIEDYPDIGIELPSMLRTTQNKIYRQGIKDPKELEDGFPAKPEELFAYQGLIIGGVEASYFTAPQQQAIHDFVDRRGGGLLFIARTRFAERWRLAEFAHGRPGSRQAAGWARHVPSRFFQRLADRAGSAEHPLPPGRKSRAQRRAVEEDSADRQLPGSGRGQTGRHHAARSDTGRQAGAAAAGDRKLRTRPHRAVRHRRKLALEDVARPCRQDPRHVLAADVPPPGERFAGPGAGHHAEIGT